MLGWSGGAYGDLGTFFGERFGWWRRGLAGSRLPGSGTEETDDDADHDQRANRHEGRQRSWAIQIQGLHSTSILPRGPLRPAQYRKAGTGESTRLPLPNRLPPPFASCDTANTGEGQELGEGGHWPMARMASVGRPRSVLRKHGAG